MKKNKITISLYAIMYFLTAFVNLYLGITQPEKLRGLAGHAFIPFIGTILKTAPLYLLRLSLIGFTIYQLTLCVLLLSRGIWHRLGLILSIIFHLGILPFGLFNLPNILLAVPPALIYRRECEGIYGKDTLER